jgi:hypothetical protein
LEAGSIAAILAYGRSNDGNKNVADDGRTGSDVDADGLMCTRTRRVVEARAIPSCTSRLPLERLKDLAQQ